MTKPDKNEVKQLMVLVKRASLKISLKSKSGVWAPELLFNQ
jgi:hypothetical protein